MHMASVAVVSEHRRYLLYLLFAFDYAELVGIGFGCVHVNVFGDGRLVSEWAQASYVELHQASSDCFDLE